MYTVMWVQVNNECGGRRKDVQYLNISERFVWVASYCPPPASWMGSVKPGVLSLALPLTSDAGTLDPEGKRASSRQPHTGSISSHFLLVFSKEGRDTIVCKQGFMNPGACVEFLSFGFMSRVVLIFPYYFLLELSCILIQILCFGFFFF